MKKRIFKRATQTGVKLLFSIMALLLVLTGCNTPTPTPPDDPTTPPNTQETELPTEQPTEEPTEEVTAAPELFEARYDAFLTLLEESHITKQKLSAEVYVQDVLNSWLTLVFTLENGQIYRGGDLYELTYVEGYTFQFGDMLLERADAAMMVVLNRLKNQDAYYFLQDSTEAERKYVVVEVENTLYFLTIYSADHANFVIRVNAVDLNLGG